jgi:hypothetical protein
VQLHVFIFILVVALCLSIFLRPLRYGVNMEFLSLIVAVREAVYLFHSSTIVDPFVHRAQEMMRSSSVGWGVVDLCHLNPEHVLWVS